MTKPSPQTVVCPDTPQPNTDETKSTDVFDVKHSQDQPVIDRITRNLKTAIRSQASRKAWATRKRMAAPRASGEST